MNQNKMLLLIDEILQKSTELKISEVLPKALTLAKLFDDKDFEKWILLEASGYYETNSALTKDVKVPNYRIVPGEYHDIYNRSLIFNDPQTHRIINNYPLSDGVAELEVSSLKGGSIAFRNPFVTQRLKEEFGVDVDTFTFNSNSIKSVLNEIRNILISWLMDKNKQILNDPNNANLITPMALSSLHPVVQSTAGDLFQNGHYRQAILDTYIALVEAVKVKSGKNGLDNSPLMQNVFAPKNPVISVSDDPDEQLGFMWLFSGAVMGIRNPKAHRLIDQNDPQRTIEWLSFASVLLRVLDDSKVNNSPREIIQK